MINNRKRTGRIRRLLCAGLVVALILGAAPGLFRIPRLPARERELGMDVAEAFGRGERTRLGPHSSDWRRDRGADRGVGRDAVLRNIEGVPLTGGSEKEGAK